MILPAWPWFGCKFSIATEVWARFGDPPNFVDVACGTASIALARPRPGKVETLNDIFGFIPNALRAMKYSPDALADEIAWCPVSELDLHARHKALLDRLDEAFVERLRADPKWHDIEIAAWWIWGQSCWIGSGWCDPKNRSNYKKPVLCGHGCEAIDGSPKPGIGVHRQLSRQVPRLSGREGRVDHGTGVFRSSPPQPIPSLSGSDGTGVGYGRGVFASGRRENLRAYLRTISARFADTTATSVRITCHDWKQMVTPAVTISHGRTAVFIDLPYGEAANRTKNLYAKDSLDIAAEARAWALEHGDDPRYLIALCGYEGEHEMPEGWEKLVWKSKGGYGNQGGENGNARKERVWFSPHCNRSGQQLDLLSSGGAP